MSRAWDEQLSSHVVNEGLATTPKDPVVYVKHGTRRIFVGGGFRVDDFVGIGSGKELGRGRREARDY